MNCLIITNARNNPKDMIDPVNYFTHEKAELTSDKQLQLVENIKNTIHQLIYFSDGSPEQNISEYIIKKVDYQYIYLNKLFSQKTGFTIKRYIKLQKIEHIKEIVIYDELNLISIARKLHYRNVSHLTEEFRKETGVSPSLYRLLRKTSLGTIENV